MKQVCPSLEHLTHVITDRAELIYTDGKSMFGL